MLAEISSSISLDSTSLPSMLRRRIMFELTMANPDKDRAISERIRGAGDLPDEFSLWSAKGTRLILPRGFAHRLEALAREEGEEIVWKSSMTLLPPSEHYFRDWIPFSLRDYQISARDSMLEWAQGIVKAPTGSGKSAITLESIRWAGQKSLVIVGKTSLARQWQAMALEHYGYETGYIGEGVWIEKDLTIALWQTLWTRKDIPDAFWNQFGMVVGDEIHHAAALGMSELFGRFPAFYRLGVSATPRWDEALFPVVKAVIGPIIHSTTHEDVGENLVKPSVRAIETDFEAEYIPTHFENRKRVQNNYSEIMSKLVQDPDRNDLIARIAREEAQAGHHVLIVTRRIEHIKQLVSRLEKTLRVGSRIHALTGAQTGHDAQRVAKSIAAAEQGTVLLSTIADEALDIPCLDRIILAFPLRRTPLVEQQVGRIVRPASNKEDAIVYDIVDTKVGVLDSQRRDRHQMFLKRGWTVERVEAVA